MKMRTVVALFFVGMLLMCALVACINSSPACASSAAVPQASSRPRPPARQAPRKPAVKPTTKKAKPAIKIDDDLFEDDDNEQESCDD